MSPRGDICTRHIEHVCIGVHGSQVGQVSTSELRYIYAQFLLSFFPCGTIFFYFYAGNVACSRASA